MAFNIKRVFSNEVVFGTLIQSVGTTFVRVLGALSGFLLNLVVARTLDINSAGLFFIVLSVVTALAQFSSFGMGNALLRFIGVSKDRGNYEDINRIFTTVVLGVCLTSVILASLLYFISGYVAGEIFGSSESVVLFKLAACAVPFVAVLGIFIPAFQSIGRPIWGLFFQAVFQPLVFCAVSLIIPLDSKGVVWVYLMSNVVSAPLVLIFWCNIRNIHLSFNFDISVIRRLRSVFRAYFGSSLVNMLIKQLPLLVGASFVATRDIAYVSISIKIAGLISFVLMSVNMVLAPKLSALYEKGETRLMEELCQKMTLFMFILAAPIFSCFVCFPSEILFVFGEEYIGAGQVLRILAVGQFINVVTGSVGVLLIMSGNQRFFLGTQLANLALLLIGLSLGAIFKLGVVYIAVVVCVGVAVQNLGAFVIVNKKLGISTFPKVYHSGPVD